VWPSPAVAMAHGARVRARRGVVTATKADAVVQVAMAHRWLPWYGVEGKGMRAVGGVRRAIGIMARLTEEVGRW
jgi:hypothetical protein